MVQQTLDSVLLEKLHGGTERVDLTDAKGDVVGHYLPHSEFEKLGGPDLRTLRDQAIEEWKRGECVPAEEVLRSLQNIRKYFESQR